MDQVGNFMGAPCFLVKRGNLNAAGVAALLGHYPGASIVYCHEVDGVRVVPSVDEPFERFAGAISDGE